VNSTPAASKYALGLAGISHTIASMWSVDGRGAEGGERIRGAGWERCSIVDLPFLMGLVVRPAAFGAAATPFMSRGITATPRVTAVSTRRRTQFGDAAAQPFITTRVKASQVEVWEKIVRRYSNQGAGLFNRKGSEPPGDPRRLPQSEIDKMSYHQRKEYAAQSRSLKAYADGEIQLLSLPRRPQRGSRRLHPGRRRRAGLPRALGQAASSDRASLRHRGS